MQISFHFQLSLELIHKIVLLVLKVYHALVFLVFWCGLLLQVNNDVVLKLVDVLFSVCKLLLCLLQKAL